eukprot:429515_1
MIHHTIIIIIITHKATISSTSAGSNVGVASHSGTGVNIDGGLKPSTGLYTSGINDVIKKAAMRLQAVDAQQQQRNHLTPIPNTFSIPTAPATICLKYHYR